MSTNQLSTIPAVRTREFRISDYSAAKKLWKRVEGVEVAEGDSRRDLEKYLSRNPGLSWVAEDGTRIVGAVLCGHDGRRGFIYHLAIDPAYRRQALGKRLVGECLAALRRAGIKRAIILVEKNNASGRRFWRRCGWEDLEEAAAMGIDPCDKVDQREAGK